MTQIITGERFVGQNAAEAKRDAEFERRFAGKRVVDRYEDPDHLFQAHADLMASEQARKDSGDALRAYINFWAGDKRRAISEHKENGCYVRCDLCFLCRACKNLGGQRWRCICDGARKFLSPYRIVFLNNSEKAHYISKTWEIGVGWVPKRLITAKSSLVARGLDDMVSYG